MTKELLELCGLEPKQIEEELPRVEKVFSQLGLTSEDIARGNERIRQFFDIELGGVRKILGVILLEFVDLVLLKEKKVIYITDPVGPGLFIEAAMRASEEVRVYNAEAIFALILGAIFDKFEPIIRAGERLWLRHGSNHCSYCLQQIGMIHLDLIPKPDLWVVPAFVCNDLAKSMALFEEVFAIPVHYMNRCVDRDWQELTIPRRELAYFASEIERLAKRVEEIVGFELTEELLDEAQQFRAAYTRPLHAIEELLHIADPMPISATLDPWLCYLKSFPLTPKATAGAIQAIELLHSEVQQRVQRGEGAVPTGAPRVFHPFYSSHACPSLVRLLEELGIAPVMTERHVYAPDGRSTPDYSIAKNYFEKIAAFVSQRTYNGIRVRANTIIGACKRFDLDGIVYYNHCICRWRGLEPWLIRDMIREELTIPITVIDIELWLPTLADVKRLRPTLEAFAEMAKDYKAAKSSAYSKESQALQR